jgi:hypothetical protein
MGETKRKYSSHALLRRLTRLLSTLPLVVGLLGSRRNVVSQAVGPRGGSPRLNRAVPAEGLEFREGYDGFCDEVGAAFVGGFRVAHSDTGLPLSECVAPVPETDVAFCCGVAGRGGQRVVRHDTHPAVGENPTLFDTSARIGGRRVCGQPVGLDPSTIDHRCLGRGHRRAHLGMTGGCRRLRGDGRG